MFNPLHMLREISQDHQLTTAEYAILAAAIVLTDNKTGRVWGGQETLARCAKVTDRTVRTFYRSKNFERYFEAELVGRRLVLTWLKPEAIPEEHRKDTGSNTGSSFRLSTSTTTSTNSFLLPTDEELEAEVVRKIRAL